MKLWRMEIPGGPNGSPYRLGTLSDVGIPSAPGDELTTDWVLSNLKHLKIDRVVELTAAGNDLVVRSVGAVADREAPPAVTMATAISGLWKIARQLPHGINPNVTIDGQRIRLNGRSGKIEARAMRVVGPQALAKLIADKNRPV